MPPAFSDAVTLYEVFFDFSLTLLHCWPIKNTDKMVIFGSSCLRMVICELLLLELGALLGLFLLSFWRGQPPSISDFTVRPLSVVRPSVNFFSASDWSKIGMLHRRGGHWGGWARRRQHICCNRKTWQRMTGWAELCYTQTYWLN